MLAARLHGLKDLRVSEVKPPGPPAAGEVLLRVNAVGICGSDLLAYQDRGLAKIVRRRPLILGHEFSGEIAAVPPEGAIGGDGRPLTPGTRVAVDPARSCGRCEQCERGHPNLCTDLHFYGLHPDDGSLRTQMLVPARNCFALPPGISPAAGAMLETLGVAMHAVELARIRVAERIAILGAGPIGLCILQVAKLAGALPILVADPLPWRLKAAERLGAFPLPGNAAERLRIVETMTGSHGVDVAIEAAWADESIQQAAELCRPGGRLVLVGIPRDDRLSLSHSTARRKGLPILLSRRMKHTYPRAIHLVESGAVDLEGLITHRFPLYEAPEAFIVNAVYPRRLIKVIIDVSDRGRRPRVASAPRGRRGIRESTRQRPKVSA